MSDNPKATGRAPTFKELVSEAISQPFSGWDFSHIASRRTQEALPWDYLKRVSETMKTSHSMLDMGTGGGERLADLAPFPAETFATEAYEPNVPIASARLEALGVTVVAIKSYDALPLDDDKFDLVINRHEKFTATELSRIMRPGGLFITQQVGERMNIELKEWLEGAPVETGPSMLERSVQHLQNAGFDIVDTHEAFPATAFHDVGAIVYYLNAIPWTVPEFDAETYHDRLVSIYNYIQEHAKLVVTGHYYFIEAGKL